MSTAYGHLLKGTIEKFVNTQLKKSPEEQNSIQEELALFRTVAEGTIAQYVKATEKFFDPELPEDQKEQAARDKFAAAELMKRELVAVANTAKTAAAIQASNTNQMTLAAVGSLVSTIVDIIYESLRVEPNGLVIAARIEKKINAQISFSVDRGVVSLPSDELVRMMDLSVPREDEL